jgi:predicted nucleotidyltransferase
MFEKIIAKTASSLTKHRIPYMIIGGQAVLLYGSPRLTKDIDITLGLSVDELQLVINAAKSAGLKVIPENVENFVKKTFVLPTTDEKTGIRVDFIFSFTSYEKQAINRAKTKVISGKKIRFATVEDVIIHKIFSGRPRDIEDVKAMLLKNPDCNMSYIKKWLAEFDKASEGKKFTDILKDIIKSLVSS